MTESFSFTQEIENYFWFIVAFCFAALFTVKLSGEFRVLDSAQFAIKSSQNANEI